MSNRQDSNSTQNPSERRELSEKLKKTSQKIAAQNPDQFELFYEKRIHTSIDSKDLKTDSVSKAEDVGLSIRVIKDQKPGFCYTTSLEDSAIEKAIQSAFDIASVMPEDSDAGLNSFSNYVYPDWEATDEKGFQEPFAKKAKLALELESLCRKADSKIAGVRAASFSETLVERVLMDAQGEKLGYRKTLFSASVTCKAEGNGDSQMGSDFGFSNDLERLDLKTIATTAAEYATELLGAKQAPTMKCPAILRHSVVAELLEFLSTSFSAEAIHKGRSLLAGKKGERLFSESVTLTDDSLLPEGYSSRPFDANGVPSQKTTLVDAGFLSQYLYDTYYARKFKTQSTSNAVRSVKSAPSIGLSNLILQPGKKSFAQLTQSIDRGILITDLMGVHTANAVTGDFSLGASGVLVENGALTRPVRGFAVAGNVLEVFRKVADTGNDLKRFGSVCTPSVKIHEISVGGS